MGANRLQIVAIWLLTTVLVALFVLAGGGKLAATDQAVHEFQRFGYPPWFMLVIGAIEVGAGLCLLFPSTALFAALALLPIMAGAAWTLWGVGDSVAPPAIVGTLIVILAWLRWSTRGAHRGLVATAGTPGSSSARKEKL